MIPDEEKAECRRACQGRKWDIGEGVCAIICLDQPGGVRDQPGGCPHAVEVFKYHARNCFTVMKGDREIVFRLVGSTRWSHTNTDGVTLDIVQQLMTGVWTAYITKGRNLMQGMGDPVTIFKTPQAAGRSAVTFFDI